MERQVWISRFPTHLFVAIDLIGFAGNPRRAEGGEVQSNWECIMWSVIAEDW